MEDHRILNDIKQWSNGNPKMKIFLDNLLVTTDSFNFPKSKADAIARYKSFQKNHETHIEKWSANDHIKRRFFDRQLEDDPFNFPQNERDGLALYEAYLLRDPNIGDLGIGSGDATGQGVPKMGSLGSDSESDSETESGKKPQAKKKSGKTPQATKKPQKSEEDIQRSKNLPITNPTIRRTPVKVFCGGGKHCGYRVDYHLGFDHFPTYCDGHTDSQSHSSKTRRVNHISKWENIVCVQNRCDIPRASLRTVLEYGCCIVCKKGLHGGIITSYGLVLH
jgi:hypothetical protein